MVRLYCLAAPSHQDRCPCDEGSLLNGTSTVSVQRLIPTPTALASRMSLYRETNASCVHAPTFLSTRLLRSTTSLEKTRKVYAMRRHSRSLCPRRWPNIDKRLTKMLQRMQVQVLPCHAAMPRHAAHSTQPKFQRLKHNVAVLLEVCLLQETLFVRTALATKRFVLTTNCC